MPMIILTLASKAVTVSSLTLYSVLYTGKLIMMMMMVGILLLLLLLFFFFFNRPT